MHTIQESGPFSREKQRYEIGNGVQGGFLVFLIPNRISRH